MALIKLNKNIIEVNRIVAYGCSYTAGTELADEKFIPNSDKLKQKMGLSKFNKEYSNILYSPELIAAQKKRTYISHLAKLLHIKNLNRATAGTSLEHHLNTFRYDILSKNIKKGDLIFLGLTSMNRWIHINEAGHELHCMSNALDYLTDSKAMIKIYNDYKLLHLHFTYLEQFLQLAKEIQTNIIIVPIHSEDISGYLDKLSVKDVEYTSVLNWRWESLKTVPQYFKDISMQAVTGTEPDELHGGNHWKESVHMKFANNLYNTIKYS